jgi:hypothetical protein
MTRNRPTPDLRSVEAEVRAWRQQHPAATLSEIEAELDQRLHTARAALLAEVVSDVSIAVGDCPDCGARLARDGRRERTLTTIGDEPVALSRMHARCPRCGSGLFPPG